MIGVAMTPAQQRLNDVWEQHVRDEFVTRNADATLETMVPDAYVNHVPVMTGGVGERALRAFYAERFIPSMPPDAADRAPCRGPARRRRPLPRQQARARAHLLGPGVRARAARPARSGRPAGRRRGDGTQGARASAAPVARAQQVLPYLPGGVPWQLVERLQLLGDLLPHHAAPRHERAHLGERQPAGARAKDDARAHALAEVRTFMAG